MSADRTTLEAEEPCDTNAQHGQLDLFASSTPRSETPPPISPCSSEPATPPSPPSSAATAGATRGATPRPAPEKPTPGSVEGAATSRVAARRMAATAQLAMPPTSIGLAAPDPMLAIARPTNRAECRDEANQRRPGNPCPWVGCRYHLLLEVGSAAVRTRSKRRNVQPERRATTLRLNIRGLRRTGRRRGLPSSAAEHLVRKWIDDAMELLMTMPHSCALDVVDQWPDGLNPSSTGYVFGTTRQAIQEEEQKPHVIAALRVLRRLRTENLIGPEVDDEGHVVEVRDDVRELFNSWSSD